MADAARAHLIHIETDRRLGHEWYEWDGRPLANGGDFSAPPGLFFRYAALTMCVAFAALATLLYLLTPRLALVHEREARGEEVQERGERGERDAHRECRVPEEESRRRGEVAAVRERPAIPLIPLVTETPVGLDMNEVRAGCVGHSGSSFTRPSGGVKHEWCVVR